VSGSRSVDDRKKISGYLSVVVLSGLTGALLYAIVPALAQSLGNSQINNQATGSFQDAAGTNFSVQSNPVTITVAEVAGITVSGTGVQDVNGGVIANGDIVNFDFEVRNIGNDPTQFRIPNQATLTGPATVQRLEVSIDGGATFTPIPAGNPEVITPSVPVGGSVLVRVVTQVAGATGGETITARLGQTPGDNQNQARGGINGVDAGDVFTVDNPDGAVPNEVLGTPVNGVREASATQSTTIGTIARRQAFVTVLKTAANYNNLNDIDPTNDVITYNLGLRVENTPPPGVTNITPAALSGTLINLGSTSTGPFVAQTRVIVADAIPGTPAQTRLAAASDVGSLPPRAPSGWQIIYSNSDPATTTLLTANWYTTPPANAVQAAAVRRIGYILDGSLPPGTTLASDAFAFSVVTIGATNGTQIDNIAQVLGVTAGNDPTDPNTPLVYDESGDQQPSNYNADGTPGADSNQTPAQFNDLVNNPNHNGVAVAAIQGIDTGNNNQGAGSGGEVNRVVIQVPNAAPTLTNGPQGAPGAQGPTGLGDSFSNNNSPPTNNTPGSTNNDPPPNSFINTVQNNSTNPTTVKLLPQPTLPGGVPTNLPPGTVVTITANGASVTYTWDGTSFTPSGPPLMVDLQPGQSLNYNVTIDLPFGTRLSTDSSNAGDPNASQNLIGGYPVNVVAFVDTNGDGQPNVGEAQESTINRVYLGFVKLFKESRVLAPDGTTVLEDFTRSPSIANLQAGNILEYRISYSNISEGGAPGNTVLRAVDFVINENGTTNTATFPDPPNGNNWGQDFNSDGTIDTSNLVGSARDTGPGATIGFFSGTAGTTPATDQTGTTQATDVTAYRMTLTIPLEPGDSRAFSFRRRLN